MKLNEYREHIVKLVEERGVAAYKYNDTIGRILNYIQNRISLNGDRYNTKIKILYIINLENKEFSCII